MAPRVRFGGLATLAAIAGIAALPAMSYSTGAAQRHGRAGKSSKAKTKKCKKDQVRKNGKCVKKKTAPASTPTTTAPATTTPAPEVLSGTIVVHVYSRREGTGNMAAPPETLDETGFIRIRRLAPDGEGPTHEMTTEMTTREHTVHVAPGRYAVEVPEPGRPSGQVTVSAGQTAEVTLYIEAKG